jgi:hypothetical protein
MGLKLNLLVHGVPMGQKIWGPKEGDQPYLSSFYGPKWDAPEVMKVDVMTFGGVSYCYYSFVKGLNVCDAQGRSGSYFALTLRINAFYNDIQNIYNILKAAYEKMCVGLCVQESNNVTKYLVTDFQNIDAQLKNIESRIISYISEFSVNEDLVGLSGFASNSQVVSPKVNLYECNKRVALEYGKKGKLMVSPCFLSTTAAITVARYKTEIETTKHNAQQEMQELQRTTQAKISSVTSHCQEDVRRCKEQARQEVEQAKMENDRKMSDLRQSYAHVDEKINRLNQTITGRDREISELKKQHQQTEKDLKLRDSSIRKLEEEITNLKNDVLILKGGNVPVPKKKRISFRKGFVISLIVFFVILLFAGLFLLLKGNSGGKKNKEKKLRQQIELLTKQNKKLQKQVAVLQLKSSKVKNSSAVIAISVTKDNKEIKEVKCGETYNLMLNGQKNSNPKGKWECPAFDITGGNKIMAKRDSAGKICKIAYIIDGKEIASKNIKIIAE